MAEERHTENGKRATHAARVLDAVLAKPGHTADEIGDYTGLGRHEAARRLSDLKSKGQVWQGEHRECTIAHTRQVTWYSTRGARQASMFGGDA
jgi:hypothetical protein